MTPEQRAALVDAVAEDMAERDGLCPSWGHASEGTRGYLRRAATADISAIEAAGYTIVRDAEHVEAVRLRSRVASQRHELDRLTSALATARAEGRLEGAREMREACRDAVQDLERSRMLPVGAGTVIARAADAIAALPLPGDAGEGGVPRDE